MIKMGASRGGIAGVALDVSGPSCLMSSINEVPLQPLRGSDHSAIMSEKKAGVVEHPEVFDHAGLLV